MSEPIVFRGEISASRRTSIGTCKLTIDIYEQDAEQYQKLVGQDFFLKPLVITIMAGKIDKVDNQYDVKVFLKHDKG